VKYGESVIVRKGYYGSIDPTRKGGSDESEEKPEYRAGGLLGRGGCIFFDGAGDMWMRSDETPVGTPSGGAS
jgi:hypothetical protein